MYPLEIQRIDTKHGHNYYIVESPFPRPIILGIQPLVFGGVSIWNIHKGVNLTVNISGQISSRPTSPPEMGIFPQMLVKKDPGIPPKMPQTIQVEELPNIAVTPENWWLEDEFPFGAWPIFRGVCS